VKRIITILTAAVAFAVPSAASAGIVRSGNTFTASPAVCSCVTTIDGYVFSGVPYYAPEGTADSAVELWLALRADPAYLSLPPVTSVSVDSTVSGEVEDDGDVQAARSSWG